MVCGGSATAQYVIRMAGSAGLLTAKVGLSARLPFRMVDSGRIEFLRLRSLSVQLANG